MLNNTNQSSFGVNQYVMSNETKTQPTAPQVVLVPNNLLRSNQFQQIQYGSTTMFVPNIEGNYSQPPTQASHVGPPGFRAPQDQQQIIQQQQIMMQNMQNAYYQQQLLAQQHMQTMYAAQGQVRPMGMALVMHNGQLVHVPVMQNGLGAIHPNNNVVGKTPTISKPSTPFSPSKAPSANKGPSASKASPRNKSRLKPSSPGPTFTPQHTPPSRTSPNRPVAKPTSSPRSPRFEKPAVSKPASSPRRPPKGAKMAMISRLTTGRPDQKTYVPPGRRSRGSSRPKPETPKKRPVYEYSVDFLIKIRTKYLRHNPPKGLFDAPSNLMASVKFDFDLFESLEISDESWKAKVEELKKSNPLVTEIRKMLNKVTDKTSSVFTGKIGDTLIKASAEGRDVLAAAIQTFMSLLFKKAAVEKILHNTYADLLLNLNDYFWNNNQDLICQTMHEQIEQECRNLFVNIDPAYKFELRGSSKWLAHLLDRGAIGDNIFFIVIDPIIENLREEDSLTAAVRNLTLDVGVNSLVQNMICMSSRGKKKPEDIRQRFSYYATTLKGIQDTFKPRERFAIMNFLEEYEKLVN